MWLLVFSLVLLVRVVVWLLVVLVPCDGVVICVLSGAAGSVWWCGCMCSVWYCWSPVVLWLFVFCLALLLTCGGVAICAPPTVAVKDLMRCYGCVFSGAGAAADGVVDCLTTLLPLVLCGTVITCNLYSTGKELQTSGAPSPELFYTVIQLF